jgi:uncharacterized integral membrane protein
MTRRRHAFRWRLATTLVLLGLLLLFALQNAAAVQVRFLFWQLDMPRSLLILVLLVIGMIIGWFSKTLWTLRRRD